jgi:outer membrane receptor for ferrienterochelin and colicins
MKKIIFLCIAVCSTYILNAQNTFNVIVKNSQSKEPLAGVNILFENKMSKATNNLGFAAFINIPDGKQTVTFSYTGMETKTETYTFPLASNDTVIILLDAAEDEMDEVIVQSTRTSRTIKNTPTRVETIDGEELDEKNNMRPANVSMLLHESTGLQVQQTSATTGNASIRVQGLDGKYTQLLKDGYPNFGNFASGLSVLEIPPLDLKQVEVIKGPASTLYGGGAIAGVVNFVSKTPQHKFEGDFILNQSNIGQTNIAGYISQKKNKLGYSLLATANYSKAFDVDKDQFSEIPKSNNFTINPRLFYYPDATTKIMLGTAYTQGSFKGGDMEVIKGNANANNVYFEKNTTKRSTTTLEIDKKLKEKNSFKIKQSLSFFDRTITIPNFRFEGINTNSFTDVSYVSKKEKHTVIAGLNLVYDRFKQKENQPGINQNAQSFTGGVYLQHTWDISENIKTESGIRIDNVNYKNVNYTKNQTFVLPRVSTLFKISSKLTSRVGAGLGYKTPTIFTEQTEALQYQNVVPLNNIAAEKSIGGTADINYKTNIADDFSFSVNQMFFITSISKPLVLQSDMLGNLFFTNAAKPVISKGFETNLKFIYKEDLKFFVGYTFVNPKATYKTGNQFLPLVPKNKLNLTLMYEKEDNFKFGLEGYLTDKQYLTNGIITPSFWEFGFMAQKTIKKVSLFINFENFTDQRQSNYKRVVNPPNNTPTFDEIWNHTEGFVFNGGLKIKL